MGIFVTLFFIAAAYLTPMTVFGQGVAALHPLVALAVLALICSFANLGDSKLWEIPQTYANIAFVFAVTMSLLLTGYMGGVVYGLVDEYLPHMMVFFYAYLNFKKRKHLDWLVVTLFLVSAFIIWHGVDAVRNGNDASPYVVMMRDDQGDFFSRIRGLGFINDPNDLSQFLVALVPMMFFLWRKGKKFRNLFLVYLPVCVLLFGMYMSHSRGALLAVMVCAMVALRKKIGVLPAVIGGGGLFVVLNAIGWSGGRDVGAGSDRLSAWAKGIELLTHYPIFGVGIHRFAEFNEITAHNSVVVTAAETGFVGLLFWVLFYLTTLYDIYQGAKIPEAEKPAESEEDLPIYMRHRVALAPAGPQLPMQRVAVGGRPARREVMPAGKTLSVAEKEAPRSSVPFHLREQETETVEPEEIRRLCEVMLISFAGFLTCGWFLSRPYTMTLYLNAGVAAVICRMGRDAGVLPPTIPLSKALKYSLYTSIGLIVFVWVMLHVSQLTK